MSETRRYCLNKLRETFKNYDFIITSDEKDELIKRSIHLEEESLDEKTLNFEKNRIEKIISDGFSIDIKEYPELIEKSIYNSTIKYARTNIIERSWSCIRFKEHYKRKFLNIYANISYNKNATFVLNKLKYGWMAPHPSFFVRKKILLKKEKNTSKKI